MVNSEKIKSRISSLGLTQSVIAEKMNINRSTLNQKINNERKMSIDEMMEFSKLLKLDSTELEDFFYQRVSK